MQRRVASRIACGLIVTMLMLISTARAEDSSTAAEKVRAVLTANCGSCHGPGGSGKGGFSFLLDRERLVNRNLVRPGKPADSPLYQRIVDSEMPPAGKKQ